MYTIYFIGLSCKPGNAGKGFFTSSVIVVLKKVLLIVCAVYSFNAEVDGNITF